MWRRLIDGSIYGVRNSIYKKEIYYVFSPIQERNLLNILNLHVVWNIWKKKKRLTLLTLQKSDYALIRIVFILKYFNTFRAHNDILIHYDPKLYLGCAELHKVEWIELPSPLDPCAFSMENNDDLKCTYCRQNRHIEDTCFLKHGVPNESPSLRSS